MSVALDTVKAIDEGYAREKREKREIISAHLVLAPHVMQSLPTACEVFRILTQTPASSAYSAWATSSKTRSSETSS